MLVRRVAWVGVVAGFAVLLVSSPAAACESSLCASPETIAITAGAGEWAEAGAVAAGVTGTGAGVASVAASTVPGVSLGATLGGSTGAAVAVAGWFGVKLIMAGQVPGLLAGGPAVPDGWTANPLAINDPWGAHRSNYYTQAVMGQVEVIGGVAGYPGTPATVKVHLVQTTVTPSETDTVANFNLGTVRCFSTLWGTVQMANTGSGVSTMGGSDGVPREGSQTWTAVCPDGFDKLESVALNTGNPDYVKTAGPAFYYREGDPRRPGSVAANHGELIRKLDCVNAAGTVAHLVSRQFITLAANGSTGLPDMACPAGSVSAGYGAQWVPDGATTPIDIVPWTTTPGWVAAIPTEYPNCLTSTCYMKLYTTATATAPAASCGDLAIACPDWYADPNRSANYECRWGPYTIELLACSAFRTPGQVKPNVQTVPATAPDGSPTTVPTTTIATTPPVTADDPAPAPGTVPAPLPAPESAACYPSGWGVLNPVEWVLKPVGCALSWAFVPKGQVLAQQVTQTRDVVTARPPFTVIATLAPIATGLGTGWNGGACSGYLANFTTIGADDGLAVKCQPPAISNFAVLYGVSVVAILSLGVFAIWHMLVGAMGGKGGGGE